MKISLWLVAFVLTLFSHCAYGQVAVSRTAVDPVVIDRGPHHVVLQAVRPSVDTLGQTVSETNSYVQLTPGISWFNPQTKQWEETKEQFEISKEGYAIALQGPHQAILSPNINTPGAVSLVTPDGKHFSSHVFGISYFDPISGNSTLIAEVKDSIGELVAPNQVIYPDAFTDFSADVRFTYTKGGWEQDVILRERPPSPESAGLDPKTTQLQVLTEFIAPPLPADRSFVTNAEPNRFLISPYLTDERLEFGAMVIGQGKAFSLDESPAIPALQADENSVRVGKSWGELAPGRTFLVESVDYLGIRPALAELPATPKSAMTEPKKRVGRLAELIRRRPRQVASLARDPQKSIVVAHSDHQSRKGYTLDYVFLNTIGNQTLKGDTTYYVTNTAVLSGVTVIEGGSVVKYTNGAQIKIQGVIDCQTSAYRPAVFTSKDDNSVGEIISGSTGNPATNYPAATALYIDNNQSDLKYIRVAHADQAIYYDNDTGYPHYLSHSQLVHCRKGIMPHNTAFFVRNVLMNDVLTNFYSTTYYATGHVEHLTANVAAYLNGSSSLISLNVTNSLLVAVTNIGTISGGFNATNSSPSDVFQAVGAGNNYLLAASSYRNVGTASISYQLQADLAALTTYPPVVLSSDFTVATTLSPQAQRDSDAPDLGYHYPPLDYVWSGLNLTNATLILTNGVAVATYGGRGLYLRTGANLVSEGTPANLNRLARYQAVQEQSLDWGASASALFEIPSTYSPRPTVQLRFTDVSLLAGTGSQGSRQLLPYASGNPLSSLAIVHCSLRGVGFNYAPVDTSSVTVGLTNTVFERCYLNLSKYVSSQDTPFTANLRNVLVWNGSLTLYYVGGTSNPYWEARDNSFDNVSLTQTDASGYILKSHNAYINATSLGGSSNVTLSAFTYAPGPLGPWYHSSTNLLDKGSRNADSAGLYHHTVKLDQIKETNSVVDIGFHYVAVNPAESEIPKISPIYPDASSSYDTTWTPDKTTNGALTDAGWHNLTYTEEPAWLRIDLGSSKNVSRVGYTGRQGTGQGVGNGNGVYRDYKIYVTDSSSTSAANWGPEVAAGQWLWQNGQERRDAGFSPKSGRYVIFRRITADGYRGPSGTDPGYANANEIWIYTRNSAFSTPLDNDGDGWADYAEDRNGNGSYDIGDSANWTLSDTDGDGLADAFDPNPTTVNGPPTLQGLIIPICPLP